MQSSLATHIDKVHSLKTVFAEHDTIQCEVSVLCQLVEKSTAQDLKDEEFGAAGGSGLSDDDDARTIQTIVSNKLERVKKEDEDEEERRIWRVELSRPRTPEPMSLEITHSLNEEDMASSSSLRQSVIDKLFQQLMTLSTQL